MKNVAVLVLVAAIAAIGGCAGSGRVGAHPNLFIESRTLSPVSPESKGVNLILNQRIVTDGRVTFLGRVVQPDGSIFFSQRAYAMDGTPISTWQEGFWSDRWNHFETRYSRTGAEQRINDAVNTTDQPDRTFTDPTALWFWHTRPKVNESVVVTYLAQNVITTSQIRYTYEGDDVLTLAGRTVTAHRVREDPLGADGVYTIWWYDDQGMGIKRYHKTTQHEYIDQLVAWR